jgi:hypothetical protein
MDALGIGSADQIIIGELKYMNVLAAEVKKSESGYIEKM